MPPLDNPRHEKFCQSTAQGLNGREAYLAAGYDCTIEAADVGASRLLSTDKISGRIAEILAKAATKAVISIASVTDRLMRIADKGEAQGEPAGLNVARQAIVDAAKVTGLLRDKVELTGADGGPISVEDITARELVERRIAGLAARGESKPTEH